MNSLSRTNRAALIALAGFACIYFFAVRYHSQPVAQVPFTPPSLAVIQTATSTPPFKKHVELALPSIHPIVTLGAANVAASSPNVFAYAHGTVEADGRFFIGMSNKSGNTFPPNQLTIFSDEADLSRPQLLSLPESGDIQTMVYDAVTDKVYFELSSDNKLSIYSIDPHTFGITKILSTTTIDAGRKPAIVTDGTYVYGITDTKPSTVYKVRISDGELVSSKNGHIANGHSAAIGIFSTPAGTSTELYFAGGMSNGFEKVDAETLRPIASTRGEPCSMSDDMPFVQTDAVGGYVYIGCETVPYGLRVNTHDMSIQRFSLPGGSFGLFAIGKDIYNAAQDGHVDMFPAGDLNDLRRFKVMNERAPFDTKGQDLQVNELLYSPTLGKLYITAWLGIPGLHQVATSTQ